MPASRIGPRASVPIPKFAHPCGTLECELRNQRDTSNVMILVPLLNPKFANGLAAWLCELRVRGQGLTARRQRRQCEKPPLGRRMKPTSFAGPRGARVSRALLRRIASPVRDAQQ